MGIEVTDERLFNAERDQLRAEVARLTDLLECYTTTAMLSHPVATANSFAMNFGRDNPIAQPDSTFSLMLARVEVAEAEVESMRADQCAACRAKSRMGAKP